MPANKGKTYPPEVLTPDEINRLFAQISAHTWLGTRNRALIGTLYRTGLRHAEGLDLMPHEVDGSRPPGGSLELLRNSGRRRELRSNSEFLASQEPSTSSEARA